MEQAQIEELFLHIITNPGEEEKKNLVIAALDEDADTVLSAAKAVGLRLGLKDHVFNPFLGDEVAPATEATEAADVDGAEEAAEADGGEESAEAAARKWTNSIGKQVCQPAQWLQPKQLSDLVDIVHDAATKKLAVRAIGSGHSFSTITNTQGAILIDPHVNLKSVLKVDTQILKPDADPANIFRVQGGILVKDLNAALDNAKLALRDMGAYDGQTVSGALSTGTHGSGIGYGPMADSILSVVLVTENGTVYQIEPENGITDPTKFPKKLPESDIPVVLKQNDDWFRTAKVAMGCLGIIYSYTLRVCPAFSLSERRTLTNWEAVLPSLVASTWNPLPEPLKTDHYELLINPYADPDGKHSCIEVKRERATPPAPTRGARLTTIGRIEEWLGVKNSWAVVMLLNWIPSASRKVIDWALNFLPDVDPPYVDVSHKVFTLGIENTVKAWALELHFDAADCAATVGKLLDALKALSESPGWYVGGPIGVRFTAASDAFLAPESGRMTCTAELDMLAGINNDRQLLGKIKEIMCDGGEGGNKSVRVHWGLDWDFTTAEDVRKWYPDFARWQTVYKEVNTTGMFDNEFTRRVKLRE
jgi:L-gulono-1,4-lactone dehydrogenase